MQHAFITVARTKNFWSKFLSLFIAISLISPAALPFQAQAASTIFSDSFENAEATNFGLWTSENGWEAIGNTSHPGHTGTKKAKVEGTLHGSSDTPAILSKSISTAGYQNVTLSYWYKVDEQLEAGNHVYVEWFDGTNWTVLFDITNASSSPSWIQKTHVISGAGNKPNFAFRFRGTQLSTSDELHLDDVSLTGDQVPPENTIPLCTDTQDNDLDGLTDFTDPDCASFIPKLVVTKVVTNDNGGTKQVSDFPLFVNSAAVTSGATNSFAPGNYTVTETGDPGYTATFSGACDANGNVTLVAGLTASCTITNDDIAPTLTVSKTVINDNGGTKSASAFTVSVTGTEVSNPSFPGSETGTVITMDAGSYSVSETSDAGYAASYSTDCSGSIGAGENKTCTITNDDIAPTLTLSKTVVNDNSGTKQASDFPAFVGQTQVAWATPVVLSAGSYQVSETVQSGYAAGEWGGDCSTTGSVTLNLGETKTCTITNDDIEVPPPPTEDTLGACSNLQDDDEDELVDLADPDCAAFKPKLTVTKVVINNNGGNKTVSSFPLSVNQTSVTSGAQNVFDPGTYTVSETNNTGYVATFSGACDSNGSVTLAIGDVKTCTITNDDTKIEVPVCPFVPQDGRTIAIFDGQKLFSDTPHNHPETSPVAVNLPAGSYKVTLYSFDGYYGRENLSQPDEEWFVRVKNGSTVLTTTGTIGDLADNVVTADKTEVVNDPLVLTQNANYVTAYHAAYPEPNVRNSVYAVCAAFDELLPVPQCANGVDDDNDGKTDSQDPGCANSEDDDETDLPPPMQCADGIDNDNDGKVDLQDPGCANAEDNDESNGGSNNGDDDPPVMQCADGIDNDNDGKVDLQDPGCANAEDNDESNGGSNNGDDDVAQCADGIDNDNDGTVDYPADFGCSSADDTDESNDPLSCVANVELLKNGNFEKPLVTAGSWGVVPNGTTDLDWVVSWLTTGPHNPATLEFQAGYSGWTAASGTQYAELDGYAPTVIHQDIQTIPGKTYRLSFDFSPRPNTATANNVLGVYAGGGLLGTHSGDGSSLSNTLWTSHSYDFVATTSMTRVQFTDLGTPADSLGTFVDDVSLTCVPPVDPIPQCADGIDNDNDGKVDLQDPGCANAEDNDESNGGSNNGDDDVAQCADGIDNDNDGKTDSQDPGCANSEDNDETDPVVTSNPPSNPPTNGGGGGGGGGIPSQYGVVNGGPVTTLGFGGGSLGQVLGASTCSTEYLTSYIKPGVKNDPEQVKKLQAFLNEFLGTNIPLTGFYGPRTIAAVRTFQVSQSSNVLKPWVDVKLHNDENTPTGYVYKTTKRWINILKCPDLNLPVPQLP